MGSRGRRSVFAGALCTGLAMLGISVHGLLGVDGELQRSAFAARQQQQHVVRYDSIRVIEHYGGCPKASPPPQSRT